MRRRQLQAGVDGKVPRALTMSEISVLVMLLVAIASGLTGAGLAVARIRHIEA